MAAFTEYECFFVLPPVSSAGDFIHSPLGYVGVSLKDRFLAVSLFDGGYAYSLGYDRLWASGCPNVGWFPSVPPSMGAAFERFWLCHMAYTTLRARARPVLSCRAASLMTRTYSLVLPPSSAYSYTLCQAMMVRHFRSVPTSLGAMVLPG